MVGDYYYGTGRRKSAVARVRLYPGNGQVVVNSKSVEEYFGARTAYHKMVSSPLDLTESGSKYNVTWGGKQYLVQQEWKVGGGCGLQ